MSEKLDRLNRLKINGYKSIKSLDIELEPLNLLIGANGVGKSNFIGFFKFMKKILDKDLQFYVAQQGGANKILHFGQKVTEEITFELTSNLLFYSVEIIPNMKDKFIFKREVISYSQGNEIILAKDGDMESGAFTSFIPDLWKTYHFHDTSVTAKVKQTSNINDNLFLSSDAHNLSAFLYAIKLNSPKSYKKIVKTIQRVAPFFHDFILEPEIHNSDMIRLKWKHKGTDAYFDANDFSDGTLRFICLTILLLQPNLPTIILLDEPELGLHPFALKLLASMFRITSKKTQIIASTQSATLADEFDIENIIVVDRVGNHSEFKRLDEDDYKLWLEEYSVGEMWQKNLIGGVPSYD
ncbi:MAG: AAA family ATPase [Sulfurovum sp.]|nr:AAA family ATPase [Sulfurovum sp.]